MFFIITSKPNSLKYDSVCVESSVLNRPKEMNDLFLDYSSDNHPKTLSSTSKIKSKSNSYVAFDVLANFLRVL